MIEQNTCYDLNNYDPSYTLIYEGGWWDSEEGIEILIFEKEDRYFILESGHLIYHGDYSRDFNRIEEISLEEAIEIVEEYEGYVNTTVY